MEKVVSRFITAAVGALFAISVAVSATASADTNPFGMQKADNHMLTVAEGKCGQGKCSGQGMPKDGKCGTEQMGKGMEGKCGAGKCGGKQAMPQNGKCGGNQGQGQGMPMPNGGNCGQGKCGGN